MQRVAVGILLRNRNVLLCQRKRGARYELQWEFPGGKVEPGESIEECLRRELHEELSITAGRIRRTERKVSHYDDGSSYEVHYCFLDTFTGTMRNNVFEEVSWVAIEKLTTYAILQGNTNFVEKLVAEVTGRK